MEIFTSTETIVQFEIDSHSPKQFNIDFMVELLQSFIYRFVINPFFTRNLTLTSFAKTNFVRNTIRV